MARPGLLAAFGAAAGTLTLPLRHVRRSRSANACEEAEMPDLTCPSAEIPANPFFRHGVLPNGMAWYVRRNATPRNATHPPLATKPRFKHHQLGTRPTPL